MPSRIQIRRMRGWRKPPGALLVKADLLSGAILTKSSLAVAPRRKRSSSIAETYSPDRSSSQSPMFVGNSPARI